MSRSNKPRTPTPDEEAFEKALSDLDALSSKLDDIKSTYNETAKKVADLTLEVKSNPPQTVPSVDGRYSLPHPQQEERPLARPNVPRPSPKKVKATLPPPPRKQSGRFYIQVPKGATSEELRAARERLGGLGRIVDSGTGTASSPESGWLEIAVRDEDVTSLISKLRKNDLQELVEKVIEVEPGEGRLQARQLDLFNLKKSSESDA